MISTLTTLTAPGTKPHYDLAARHSRYRFGSLVYLGAPPRPTRFFCAHAWQFSNGKGAEWEGFVPAGFLSASLPTHSAPPAPLAGSWRYLNLQLRASPTMSHKSQSATADRAISLPAFSPASVDPTHIRFHLEKANEAANAIASLASLSAKMFIERSFEGCPEWNNDYHLRGLFEAVHALAGRVGEALEKPILKRRG